jgi:hypothetical protein
MGQFIAYGNPNPNETGKPTNIGSLTLDVFGENFERTIELKEETIASLAKAETAIQSVAGLVTSTQLQAVQTLVDNLEYVKDVVHTRETGDLVFYFQDGSELEMNVYIDNLKKGLSYNAATRKLIVTKVDDSVVEIDVSDLVDEYFGTNEEPHIQTIIGEGNTIRAILKNGTITKAQLLPALVTEIEGKANASAIPAKTTTVPLAPNATTGEVGNETTFAAGNHRHPLQTSVTGSAGSVVAGGVQAGTLVAGVVATDNTDYGTGTTNQGTYRVRNISYGAAAMVAGTTPLANGRIYLQYEV